MMSKNANKGLLTVDQEFWWDHTAHGQKSAPVSAGAFLVVFLSVIGLACFLPTEAGLA